MSLTNPNWTPGRAPKRVDPNNPVEYAKTGNAVSKSTVAPRTNWSNKAGKMVSVSGLKVGKPGGKGSVVQPKGTYSYKKPVGSMGSPDAREARNKRGYDGYTPRTSTPEDPYAWLKDLLGGGGGGGGSTRAYSDQQIADTTAKLQALYNRYAQDIASREADIAANYDKSGANLGSIYDTSVGNINKAYDAARAAQTQQLLALGMTEQTPVAQFGNQTAAITSLNNLRAAVLAQNEASKNTAITNQRLAAEAAQREGAQQAAQAAAQMASQMVSTGGGGGGGGGGLSPYQYASLVLQQQKADSANQQAAAKLAAQSAANQPSAPIDWQSLINNVAGAKDLTPAQASLVSTMARYNK